MAANHGNTVTDSVTKNAGRCNNCKKKLGLMAYTCKCEKLFCIKHLHPEEHACNKVEARKEQEKSQLKKALEFTPTSTFERI